MEASSEDESCLNEFRQTDVESNQFPVGQEESDDSLLSSDSAVSMNLHTITVADPEETSSPKWWRQIL
jgi:hypothetical protein